MIGNIHTTQREKALRRLSAIFTAFLVTISVFGFGPGHIAKATAGHPAYTITVSPAAKTIKSSALLAPGLTNQAAIDAALSHAFNDLTSPLDITLSSDNTGNTGYDHVRFTVSGADEHLQLWVRDFYGHWFDMVKTGLGSEIGFSLQPTSSLTMQVYPVSDAAPSSYALTVALNDLDQGGMAIVQGQGALTVYVPQDYSGNEALAFVQPQDFGVMQQSGVNGYNVGFKLVNTTASHIKKAEVSLYNGATVLATATSDRVLSNYPDTDILSAPFNITGTFNYASDTSWTYSGWKGAVEDVPTKAEIKITDALDNTYTVENANLTGDPSVLIPHDYSGDPALAFVQPEDFGVMRQSGVNGYTVGFKLLTVKAGELKGIEVSLYKDDALLAKNLNKDVLTQYATVDQLSSPFNINGTFDYAADGAWANGGWAGTVNDVPTKAVIKVTDWMGNTYTVTNSALSGDPTALLPRDYSGNEALAFVQPQDFGVMQQSGINGYTVGFKLLAEKPKNLKKIEVKLYKGQTLLATNLSDRVLVQYPEADQLSSPFNVNGPFDYVKDGAWANDGWNGNLTDVPTKAVIVVTDKMDNTYTVENSTLTGAPLPYITMGDFGVMQLSGVNGYSVGFGLVGMQAKDLKSVAVKLYKGNTLLSSNTAAGLLSTYADATSLSAPFNINGTFSYSDDGAWTSSGWNGQLSDVPDKVEIQAIDQSDNAYQVTSANVPSGDPSLLIPQNYTGAEAGSFAQFTDFGTMRFSGVNGYTVGFSLINLKPSQIANIQVELYKGNLLLSSATNTPALLTLGQTLSAPFNINGTFNYAADGYWTNSGWKGSLQDVPTKAVIVITDVFGDTITLENAQAPAGQSLPYAVAEDFGVMQQSGVNGYSVGFGLVGMQASDLKSATVELYKDSTLLAKGTNNQLFTQYPTATHLSAPFDIDGTFDYAADGAWAYSGWKGTVSDVPNKAVITLTDRADAAYILTNTQLSGDPSSLDVQPPVITLNGNAYVKVYQNTVYADAGATVTDNVDAIRTIVPTQDSVDASKLGTYIVTFDASDARGNAATAKTRTVEIIPVPGNAVPLSGGVTTSTSTPVVVIDHNAPATSTITVPADVTNSTLDLSAIAATTSTGTLATLAGAITIQTSTAVGDITIQIPAGTEISAAPTWTGTINVPQVKSNSSVQVTPDPGHTANVSSVIEIGFGDTKLVFNKAVRVLMTGQAGKYVGYARSGVFTPITSVCSADTQVAGDSLPVEGDCKINVASDLVIWTKHFTNFVTYTQNQTASGGGGSGGGAVYVIPVSAQPQQPHGQILGEAIIKDGTLVLDGPTVYLISKGQKRPFASEAEFTSYGFKFSDVVKNDLIKTIPQGQVMRALDGTLALDKGTVYLLSSSGIKRGFVSAKVFLNLGYKFSQVKNINLSDYQAGPVIDTRTSAHPDGTLVLNNKTVWWIRNGHRSGIPSMEVLSSYGLSLGIAVQATPSDMALPTDNIVKARDLALAE